VRTKTLVTELLRVRMSEARPNSYEFGYGAFGYGPYDYGAFSCEHSVGLRSLLIRGA